MADLDQERADLNALVREAHETIKDLNAAIKASDKVLAQMQEAHDNLVQRIKDTIELEVRQFIELAVEEQTNAYVEAMHDHTLKSIQQVYDRFDALETRLTAGLDEETIREAIKLRALLEVKGIRP